jgi:hypothetical protein
MAGKDSNSASTEASGSSTKSFKEKLDEAVEAIKANAQGVTCEDCPFATFYPGGSGMCHKATSITGEFLKTSTRAPACDDHPRLKALKAELLSIENR